MATCGCVADAGKCEINDSVDDDGDVVAGATATVNDGGVVDVVEDAEVVVVIGGRTDGSDGSSVDDDCELVKDIIGGAPDGNINV